MGKVKVKEKGVLFYVHLEVYPFDIMVYFGKDKKPMINSLAKKRNADAAWIEYLKGETWGPGDTIVSKKSNWVALTMDVVPETIRDYSILVHEVYHVAFNVLKIVGVQPDHEEAHAYLMEFIYKKILLKLDKVNKKTR